MTLRCKVDKLLMRAEVSEGRLLVFDGDECFRMDSAEAGYYELVAASRDELAGIAGSTYRLLRFATDFCLNT
jgi:hypothetical protein